MYKLQALDATLKSLLVAEVPVGIDISPVIQPTPLLPLARIQRADPIVIIFRPRVRIELDARDRDGG